MNVITRAFENLGFVVVLSVAGVVSGCSTTDNGAMPAAAGSSVSAGTSAVTASAVAGQAAPANAGPVAGNPQSVSPPAPSPARGMAGRTGAAGRAMSGGSGAAGAGAGGGMQPAAAGSLARGGSGGSGGAGRGGAGAPALPAAGSGAASPAAAGYVRTQGAKLIDSQGREVRITGVSWFGMETPNFAPYGLANRPLGALLDQIKALGFNSVRLPFSNQLFDATSKPSIGGNQNADLAGLSGLQLMDKIVQGAGQRGLKIILDRHRPDANAQSELWYTSQYTEQRWIDDWKMLATHYKSDATVIAADLHNEPRGMASWGDGNMATDWQKAAERAGNAILQINPNWLIIVEGIEKYENDYYWWGGNLRGAGAHLVTLMVPNRVVYSTHDYPASLFAQNWFSAADYPNNLPGVWSRFWGYLAEQDIAPVFVGEFGSKLQSDSDKKWLHALTGYIGMHKLNWAFWCLNPNSDDTGGILQDDWMSVNQEKMTELKPILAEQIR